jgi:hypothetical protein
MNCAMMHEWKLGAGGTQTSPPVHPPGGGTLTGVHAFTASAQFGGWIVAPPTAAHCPPSAAGDAAPSANEATFAHVAGNGAHMFDALRTNVPHATEGQPAEPAEYTSTVRSPQVWPLGVPHEHEHCAGGAVRPAKPSYKSV